jgi:hypothetical protein
MKKHFNRLVLAGLFLCMGVSCTTTYDAQGRPHNSVNPAAALIGVAVVGLIAYGIANSDDDDDHDHDHHRCRNNSGSNYGYRNGRRNYY